MLRSKRTRLRIAEKIMASLMGSPATKVNGEPYDSDIPIHMKELAQASINGAEFLMAANKQGWSTIAWMTPGQIMKELKELKLRAESREAMLQSQKAGRSQGLQKPLQPTPATLSPSSGELVGCSDQLSDPQSRPQTPKPNPQQ